jgi:hypothetical protein
MGPMGAGQPDATLRVVGDQLTKATAQGVAQRGRTWSVAVC